MFEIILNAPISMFVAMAALTGVAVHDTKVDKLATSLVGVPAAVAATDGGHKLASDPHTHVERVSVEKIHRHELCLVMTRKNTLCRRMYQKAVTHLTDTLYRLNNPILIRNNLQLVS